MAAHATIEDQLASLELVSDPYPLYDELRESHPVYWSEGWNAFLVTRYDDVVDVLRDYRRFVNAGRYTLFMEQLPPERRAEFGRFDDYWTKPGFNLSDPPDHALVRTLTKRFFTRRAMERVRPRVQALVDELIDNVIEQGEADLVRDIATPLPATIIAELLGLPTDDVAWFKRSTLQYISFLGTGAPEPDTIRRSEAALLELREWISGVVGELRREPRDDILTALVAAHDSGKMVSEDQLLATCIDLASGGDELLTHVIGTGILSLHQHPDQLQLLREDPNLLPMAIAEMLRYEPPFQQDWRRTTEDTEIRGVHIPAGSILRLMLAAANRDPRVFDDPGLFDIRRDPNRHIAFGFGIHLCVGAPLAEVELDIAFNTLLRRLNGLQVATDTFEWHPSNGPRGLKTLPITFEPGARVSAAPRLN